MKRPELKLCDFTDKTWLVDNLISEMQRRCQTIFKWDGLPATIDTRWLEQLAQTNGKAIETEIKDDEVKQLQESREIFGGHYVFEGDPGGVEDFNDLPTFVVIAHPRLKNSLTKKIDEDCVVIWNDSAHRGLYNLHLRWATQLAEAILTLDIDNYTSRATNLLTAGRDKELDAFKNYIEDLKSGKLSGIIGNAALQNIKLQPFAGDANNMITNVIEEIQFLKASWARELGMDENFNMKREAILADEATMGEESIRNLLVDMLNERRKAARKMNELYGWNVTVDFAANFKEENGDIVNGEEDTSYGTDESGETVVGEYVESDETQNRDISEEETSFTEENGDSESEADDGTGDRDDDNGEAQGDEIVDDSEEIISQQVIIENVEGDVIISEDNNSEVDDETNREEEN